MIDWRAVKMESVPKRMSRYITDETGERTAIILPIDEYQELIEDLEDLAVLAERRDEPAIPHAEVVAKLKADGYL